MLDDSLIHRNVGLVVLVEDHGPRWARSFVFERDQFPFLIVLLPIFPLNAVGYRQICSCGHVLGLSAFALVAFLLRSRRGGKCEGSRRLKSTGVHSHEVLVGSVLRALHQAGLLAEAGFLVIFEHGLNKLAHDGPLLLMDLFHLDFELGIGVLQGIDFLLECM